MKRPTSHALESIPLSIYLLEHGLLYVMLSRDGQCSGIASDAVQNDLSDGMI